MLRLFDIILSATGLLLAAPLLFLIYLLGLFDTGSPLFYQERVGINKKPFILIKFRTMKINTACVASHLANFSDVTRLGAMLRKTKLDELPQLWNVFKGEMSLVGPRPCLYSQIEVIRERERQGVFDAKPGITGLSQIHKIDMSTPMLLAETDASMLKNLSINTYLRYISITLMGGGSGDRIKNGRY